MPEKLIVGHNTIEIKRPSGEVTNNFWDGFLDGPGLADRYNYYDKCFNTWTAGDWTVTATQAVTEGTIASSGGVLRLPTVGGAENDVTCMQLGEVAGTETFLPTAGKRIWFGCSFTNDEATQVDMIAGLCDTDTGLPAARPSDGIYFFKDDGDTNIDFNSSASSVDVGENGIHTFVAGTFAKYQFRVNGTNTIDYWVNDIYKGSITQGLAATEMRITLGQADGDGAGGADNFDIRYVYCYQER